MLNSYLNDRLVDKCGKKVKTISKNGLETDDLALYPPPCPVDSAADNR